MSGSNFKDRLLKKIVIFWLLKNWRKGIMLKWVIISLGLAVVAGILGFSGITATASLLAKTAFLVFVIVSFITFVLYIFRKMPK